MAPQMSKLSGEERRALILLAGHPNGCDEAVLLTEGVTVGLLAGLVIDGFANMSLGISPSTVERSPLSG